MLSICYGVLWILQFVKTKLVDVDALDEVACPPQMECELKVDLERLLFRQI